MRKLLCLFLGCTVSFACCKNSGTEDYDIQVTLESIQSSEEASLLHLKKYSLIVSPKDGGGSDTLICYPAGKKSYTPSPVYIFTVDKFHWVLVGNAQVSNHFLTVETINMETFIDRYGDEGDYFFMDIRNPANRVASSFCSAYKIEESKYGYRLYYKKDPRSLFRTIAQDEKVFSRQKRIRSTKKRTLCSSKIQNGRITWKRDFDYSYLIQHLSGTATDTILFSMYSFPFPERIYIQQDTIFSVINTCPKRHWGVSKYMEVNDSTLKAHGIINGMPIKQYWISSSQLVEPIIIVSIQNRLPYPKIKVIEVPYIYHSHDDLFI